MDKCIANVSFIKVVIKINKILLTTYTIPKSIFNLSCVCLFVCLCVCHVFVTKVTQLNISGKWSQNFTKLSGWVPGGLPSWFIMFVCMHVRACMHSAWKHAYYFCDFFATFFGIFVVIFWLFWSLSLLKMKKKKATFQIGIDVAHLFGFIHFFPFW